MAFDCTSCRYMCYKLLCEEEKNQNAYGYIYLLREEEKIEIQLNEGIPFNENGILKNIIHEVNDNKDIIKIQQKGIYEVVYYLDNSGKETLALELNDLEIQGSRYSPQTGSSIDYGQVIIKIQDSNSILRLINKGSNISINQLTPQDDADVILASIFIEKIDDI